MSRDHWRETKLVITATLTPTLPLSAFLYQLRDIHTFILQPPLLLSFQPFPPPSLLPPSPSLPLPLSLSPGIASIGVHDVTATGVPDILLGRSDGVMEIYSLDENNQPRIQFTHVNR